jgi:hypothetical protein
MKKKFFDVYFIFFSIINDCVFDEFMLIKGLKKIIHEKKKKNCKIIGCGFDYSFIFDSLYIFFYVYYFNF